MHIFGDPAAPQHDTIPWWSSPLTPAPTAPADTHTRASASGIVPPLPPPVAAPRTASLVTSTRRDLPSRVTSEFLADEGFDERPLCALFAFLGTPRPSSSLFTPDAEQTRAFLPSAPPADPVLRGPVPPHLGRRPVPVPVPVHPPLGSKWHHDPSALAIGRLSDPSLLDPFLIVPGATVVGRTSQPHPSSPQPRSLPSFRNCTTK